MNSSQGGMDEYTFNNYPGMEYNNAPVDVEATLNSLLASPTEPYDFSASLLSNAPLRTSIPLRSYPPNIANVNTSGNITNNVQIVNPNTNTPIILPINSPNINHSGIPLIPPPPPAGTPIHPPFQTHDLDPMTPGMSASQLDAKRKRRRKDDIFLLVSSLVLHTHFFKHHIFSFSFTFFFTFFYFFKYLIFFKCKQTRYRKYYCKSSDILQIYCQMKCARDLIGLFINLLKLIILSTMP
jgi:hypothetical protein